MRIPGASVVATFLALWIVPAVATAQPPPAEEGEQESAAARAIEIGRQGIAAYDRGEWQTALLLFEEADELYHSPVFVLYAARCQRSLGKLLDAKRLYLTLANDTIPDDAAASWKQAQVDGAADLEALEREIPRVTVTVVGASEQATATLDGRTIPLGEPEQADPGEHEVTVRDGLRAETKQVELRRGDLARVVELDLTPKPKLEPQEKPPPPPPPPPPETDDTVRIFGIALTGVGVAAVGAGAVFGVLALNESSSAEDELPASCGADLQCPKYREPDIEESFSSSRSLSTVADVLLIGGAVVATAGIVLWVVAPDEETEVRASATLGGASVQGHF